MAPKFGTSGLRGLVTDLTEPVVSAYVRAFLATCPVGTGVFLGQDLRPSSAQLAEWIIQTVRAQGIDVTDCGQTPTPALALAAEARGAAAIMVTGSHIPADRNGLKFYTPQGEITKTDETAILGALDAPGGDVEAQLARLDANATYQARYVKSFGLDALTGIRIGAYTHSTVGRNVLISTLSKLGAEVIEIARSDHFVPVDTEAVDPETRQQLAEWASANRLDSIVSMDGDGDRPMLTDENGRVIPGDVLGQITAAALGAQTIVTPVSSNTGVEQLGFDKVVRTRIGSPFVIAAMTDVGGKVIGYEANGGLLLGFEADGPKGRLSALMTRDSMLPIIAVLAKSRGSSVAQLVAGGPQRFTAADRLQEIAVEASQNLVQKLRADPTPLLDGLQTQLEQFDETDGLRMHLSDDRIVHIRPSGNAPELRCYVDAPTQVIADATLKSALLLIRAMV